MYYHIHSIKCAGRLFNFGLLGWALIRGWALIKILPFSAIHLKKSAFITIDKTKKKEHCSKFIPSIYDNLGGVCLIFEAQALTS